MNSSNWTKYLMNDTYRLIVQTGSDTKLPHLLKFYDKFSNRDVYLTPENFYTINYILYKLSSDTEDQARFFIATKGLSLEEFLAYRQACDNKSDSAKQRKTTCGLYDKSGNNNPMFGKTHSTSTKSKISKSISERNKGRHWFNDGKTNYLINAQIAFEQGLKKGRL